MCGHTEIVTRRFARGSVLCSYLAPSLAYISFALASCFLVGWWSVLPATLGSVFSGTLGSVFPGTLGSVFPGTLGSVFPGTLGSVFPGTLGSTFHDTKFRTFDAELQKFRSPTRFFTSQSSRFCVHSVHFPLSPPSHFPFVFSGWFHL